MSAESYAGVGLFELLGLGLDESRHGYVKGSLEIGPGHRNRMGYVHGGVICTMIDFAACASGLHAEKGEDTRYAVTISLTTQFVRPVRAGRLSVEGRMISAGRSSFTAEAHVFDDSGERAAHGIGTFRWRAGSRPNSSTSHGGSADA